MFVQMRKPCVSPQAEAAPHACAQTWQVGYGLGFVSHLPHHGTDIPVDYIRPAQLHPAALTEDLNFIQEENPKQLLLPNPALHRAHGKRNLLVTTPFKQEPCLDNEGATFD